MLVFVHKHNNAFVANIKRYKALYFLLLPGVIYYIIFHYYPMYGLIIAFKNFRFVDGFYGSEWIGFRNFDLLFHSMGFYKILRNTLLISLYKLVFSFPFPIIVAILLNEIRLVRFKRITQTIIYFPHFLSWVVVGGIVFKFLQMGDEGVINGILTSFGMKQIPFLTSPTYFRGIIVISALWKEMGYLSIIFIAAITVIDQSMYEAAYVDGANKFQQIWHITIPALMPTIFIMFIIRMGNILNVGFEQIFMLYNASVYDVSDVFSTYIYRVGITQMRYSYTTAVGLFQSVVSLIFIVAANKLAGKTEIGGLW